MLGRHANNRATGCGNLPRWCEDQSVKSSQKVAISTGISLRVVEFSGAGASGRDILLLHGLASNALLWAPAGELLGQRGHRVVAADLRGHGLSDKPSDGYSMDQVVADVVALIDELELQNPIVVGQSWGGNVVVEVAKLHGDSIAGIVAVDGGGINLRETFTTWEECVAALHPPHLEGTPASKLRAAIKAMRPRWSESAIDGTMSNMEVLDDGTVRPWLSHERHVAILRGLWSHDPFEALNNGAVPTLFVPALPSGATKDAWSKQKMAAHDRIATLAHVKVIPFWDADHDLHAEQPEAFTDAVHTTIEEGFFG